MNTIISNALAGLDAARQRLEISAADIANADSVGPSPTSVADASASPPNLIGALPMVLPIDPRLVRRVVPDSPAANPEGIISNPIVDLAGEGINQIAALSAYAANARVIQVTQELEQEMAAMIGHRSHDITA